MTETPPATGPAAISSPTASAAPTAKYRPWPRPKLNLDLKASPATWAWSIFRQRKKNGSTLEYQALKFPPTEEDLKMFAGVEEPRQRRIILARLRMREKAVNLKTLPVVGALVAVAAAVIGLSLAAAKTEQPDIYGVYLTGIITFVLVAAVIVLFALRNHTHKEACLTAWIEAFEDTHSLQTKLEEEERKAKAEAASAAAPTDGTMPAVVRYGWAVKMFG